MKRNSKVNFRGNKFQRELEIEVVSEGERDKEKQRKGKMRKELDLIVFD